jgi:hypothetical protein
MHVQQCINKKLKLQLLKAHTENRNYKAEHQCILNCSSHKLKTYTSQTANRVLLILTTNQSTSTVQLAKLSASITQAKTE